eukprot:COSAG01_NODE_5295_length_4352_cov_7.332236_9_plen_174_part_00
MKVLWLARSVVCALSDQDFGAKGCGHRSWHTITTLPARTRVQSTRRHVPMVTHWTSAGTHTIWCMVPPFRVSQGVAAAKLPNGMHHHHHHNHHHNHHHHHHHHTLVPPCSHCEHQEIDQLKTHYTAFRIARAIRVLTIADHLSCTLPPRIRHRRWHDRPPHGGRSPAVCDTPP